MTIFEAIRRADELKPNRFSAEQKLNWLATLEGQIYNEIVLTHENLEGREYNGFDTGTDTATMLLAPSPYDDVYVFYLQAQIDLSNMEMQKYNNSKTLFNNAFMTLRDYWNRTHKPIQRTKAFYFGGVKRGIPT